MLADSAIQWHHLHSTMTAWRKSSFQKRGPIEGPTHSACLCQLLGGNLGQAWFEVACFFCALSDIGREGEAGSRLYRTPRQWVPPGSALGLRRPMARRVLEAAPSSARMMKQLLDERYGQIARARKSW